MKRRINLGMVIISILSIIATVIGITFVYYGLFQKQIQDDLVVNAKLLRDTHYFAKTEIDVADIDLSTGIDELRVTWIGNDGTVLYDNDVTNENMANHNDRPEIQEALKNGEGKTVRHSETMNQDTYYYAVLLDNGTILRVATNARSLWSVFMSVALIVTMIIFVIVIICIVISHLLTEQLLKPIEMMAEHLEDKDYQSPYRELDPFAGKIRSQHMDILSAAKARQDFTANVSHELKTPLTAISGYVELLQTGMVGENQKNHFYEEIQKNVGRLLSLINDIIRLSEIDQGENHTLFEEFDLDLLMLESIEPLMEIARQKEVEINLESSSCMIYANKNMIKELIENLVHNAIQYNNPGGQVSVIIKNDKKAVLIVKDNGIGIPLSDQDRIFERFYRVDKSRSKATGGTGLGLAIVKHIVEIHDASIELDSAPGIGTSIKIVF